MREVVIISGKGGTGKTSLVASFAGQKALDLLKRTAVKMYIGAGDMTIKEAYSAYKNGQLKTQF